MNSDGLVQCRTSKEPSTAAAAPPRLAGLAVDDALLRRALARVCAAVRADQLTKVEPTASGSFM